MFFLHIKLRFPRCSPVLTNLILHTLIRPLGSDPWDRYKTNRNTCRQYIGFYSWSPNSVVKTLWIDCITTSHMTPTVNICGRQHTGTCASYVKIKRWRSKICKKKNLSWLFCADRKIGPSGSLFGITRQSLVMPNSDPRTD